MKGKAMEDRFYLLRVSLVGSEPDIWRRFVVPAEITLDRLHDVIQVVMGWTDSHLHQFEIGKKVYTENPEFKEDGLDENGRVLVDLIKQKGRTFGYEYDFGDGWKHKVTIEDSRHPQPMFLVEAPVSCLDGANACPPEDVGGIDGYYNFCKALQDPKHKEHQQYKEWVTGIPNGGANFNSERFDIDKVNTELLKYLRWSRNRYPFWRYDL
jgi:pRiA4b ORF-3-like protein